jgi:ubiquinone/menaquinone biosynthesis C-methylase UbiE
MRDEAEGPGWAGDEYAEESSHHRRFDDWFLDHHTPRPHDRVVDAGCGSGEFTARLASLTPDGHVIGVEPDASMLETADRHVRDNLEFRRGRVQELDDVCEASWADVVVSRSVFHWLSLADYLPSYEAVRRVLRPGGWFHAESGGAGNVSRLARVLDEVATGLGLAPATVSFPDAGSVLELLEQAGFEVPRSGVTTVAQRRSFDRQELTGFLRTQAALAYGLGAGSDLPTRFLAEASEHLEDLQRHDGSYDQTFVRLHVLCRRPG